MSLLAVKEESKSDLVNEYADHAEPTAGNSLSSLAYYNTMVGGGTAGLSCYAAQGSPSHESNTVSLGGAYFGASELPAILAQAQQQHPVQPNNSSCDYGGNNQYSQSQQSTVSALQQLVSQNQGVEFSPQRQLPANSSIGAHQHAPSPEVGQGTVDTMNLAIPEPPPEFAYHFDAKLIVTEENDDDPNNVDGCSKRKWKRAVYRCTYPCVSWNARAHSWLVYYEDSEGRKSKTFNPKKLGRFFHFQTDIRDFLMRLDPIEASMHQACVFAAQVRWQAKVRKHLQAVQQCGMLNHTLPVIGGVQSNENYLQGLRSPTSPLVEATDNDSTVNRPSKVPRLADDLSAIGSSQQQFALDTLNHLSMLKSEVQSEVARSLQEPSLLRRNPSLGESSSDQLLAAQNALLSNQQTKLLETWKHPIIGRPIEEGDRDISESEIHSGLPIDLPSIFPHTLTETQVSPVLNHQDYIQPYIDAVHREHVESTASLGSLYSQQQPYSYSLVMNHLAASADKQVASSHLSTLKAELANQALAEASSVISSSLSQREFNYGRTSDQPDHLITR